ncbi:YvrJ family protein [Bacillus sp. NTK071]|nr:YvrJ family protein [Bacillus sp. NTK071]MBN8209785.1 YvrJ family protein [Bacillus sp. NTK071]
MESWMSLISDVGFPIVVTLYLLHRIEGKLDTLNDTILQLPDQLNARSSD